MGFLTSLDNLVKMGCQMSKQLKRKNQSTKKTDPAARPLVKASVRERNSKASIIHLPSPACIATNKSCSRYGDSKEVTCADASVKVDVQLSAYIPDPALSSRTTDSGDSPTEISASKKALSIMFDDEVIFALAAADEEDRMREDAEFRAIIRSLG